MALLALVAGQDVEPAEGSDGTDGRWRIARKVAEDRVISTWTRKRGIPASHQRTAVTGTAPTSLACPQTGIITGEELTMAAGEENSDAASPQCS